MGRPAAWALPAAGLSHRCDHFLSVHRLAPFLQDPQRGVDAGEFRTGGRCGRVAAGTLSAGTFALAGGAHLTGRIPSIHGKRAIRHVIYDTNWWKSFTHARLAVAMGGRGCLSLFGDRPETHRMFAEQVTAQYFVKTEGRGRTVDEWKPRPEQPDNHWRDCLIGCAVGASMQGSILFGTDGGSSVHQKDRVSLKELQRKKRS